MKRDRSFISSPEWLKHKKATQIRKNSDDNCFHYPLTVALNHQNIEKKKILKEYQKLNLALISIIGNKQIFHHTEKTGKSLNKTIGQLILTSYLYHTILKK